MSKSQYNLVLAGVIWSIQNAARPHTARDFYRDFAALCREVNVTVVRKQGRQVCSGLRLVPNLAARADGRR